MKQMPWFLVFLLFFLVLIGLLVLLPVPSNPAGGQHPEYQTMLKSGSSVVAITSSKWLAYAFGLGVLGLFGFSIFLGAQKNPKAKNRKIQNWLWVGTALYLLVYTLMVFSYWDYAQTDQPAFWGGFPAPTAWMLFGLGIVPILFTCIYVFKFKEWVITKEELEQFNELINSE